ncbi:MAG: ion transporter [Muribaculaceae bacterium]|nr:ion transporter [Muribaculaceae bacterium]
MITREQIYSIIEPKYNNQDSLIARVYDWVMLIAIIISIIPLMFREQRLIFVVFDFVSCGIFILDYLLRWVTADMRFKKRGKLAFLIYPITPMAIIDILSILPTFNFVRDAFKIGRVIRLLKIVRVVKIIRYFEPLKVVVAVINKQRVLLGTVLALAIFYVFVTALIMFNAEEQINPETGKYLFPTFFDAFYWAACTVTTVGYGDLYPISTTGRVISIISAVIGIAIIALPSGIITAGYINEIKERRKKGHHRHQDDEEA